MEIAEPMAPAGKLAEDQRRPPLREDLASLRDRTELAVSLHTREVCRNRRQKQVHKLYRPGPQTGLDRLKGPIDDRGVQCNRRSEQWRPLRPSRLASSDRAFGEPSLPRTTTATGARRRSGTAPSGVAPLWWPAAPERQMWWRHSNSQDGMTWLLLCAVGAITSPATPPAMTGWSSTCPGSGLFGSIQRGAGHTWIPAASGAMSTTRPRPSGWRYRAGSYPPPVWPDSRWAAASGTSHAGSALPPTT